MSWRKGNRRGGDGVELNLAAMLDMAFQLLTFFILTFRPAAVETQLQLRLPAPQPVGVATGPQRTGDDINDKDPATALDTLVISAMADPAGRIAGLAVFETPCDGPAGLRRQLQTVLKDPQVKFEQVIVQAGEKLRYDEFMHVLEACSNLDLPDGTKLSKLSVVKIPDAMPRR